MVKLSTLPGVGEFISGLNTSATRRAALGDVVIHNKALLTDIYVDNVTRSHKIVRSTVISLSIQRKSFFDKLGEDIHRLAGMDVPILLVWGRQDRAIPVQRGQEMHRILKTSRLEILDDAGHVPNFERADRFNLLAVDFLRG